DVTEQLLPLRRPGIEEELQCERAVGRTGQRPFDPGGTWLYCAQHGEVLEMVGPSHRTVVVGAGTVVTQVDPQAGVGENLVGKDGIALAVADDGNPIVTIRGDDVAGARGKAADLIVGTVDDAHAVEPVAEEEWAEHAADEVALNHVARGGRAED